ncbi:site-specific DNA-methyltransferase [Porphyromonas endodontalis]|uniref:site-specific DNA-methyltransferase n=1 Tax=Porphyromonas endodontalis TaxID=28124 RepID=UPI0028E6D67A|nr:site-specific DNA-methyltransferase [Porphyromonas endodontalis]
MELKKQALTSAAHSEFTLEALRQIAPSAFTEVRGTDGELTHKVDFDVLRELLGDAILDANEECFGFHWVGKQAAKRAAAEPTRQTLRPIVEDSVDWDTTENLYIEGDNLEVLKLLQRAYLGKVKMIYIDPPYNTGNDFVYQDDFAMSGEEMDEAMGNLDGEGNRLRRNLDSNPRYHSDWCSMMYSRLLVARTLLTNDGVIFISIDDNEVHHLRKICDEVFGASNFVASINWKGRGGRQDSKYYAVIHEYILCYAKSLEKFKAGEDIKEEGVYPKFDNQKQRFYKTQLLRKWGSNSLRTDRPNLYYPISAPDGSDIYPTIYVEDKATSTLQRALDEDRIEFVKNKFGDWIPYEKIYAPLSGEEQTKKYTTWIDDTSNGTEVLKDLFERNSPFDYSKSPALISRFLRMANIEGDDVILDFFSGSATTAHAVMQLNAEDGGKRKYICVQLPEETPEGSEARKAGYKTICEIGKERIRRAGKQIKDDPKNKDKKIDTGFRVLRVDSSNMEEVYFEPVELKQKDLFSQENSVKSDRTELDLLFGCMVDWGVELSYPLRKEEVAGRLLHIVNEGSLVACFDKDINLEAIRYIASMKPQRTIFRESCFATDADKLNIYEQLKQLCGWSDDEAYKRIHVI